MYTSIFSSQFRVFQIQETRFNRMYPNSCSSGCLLKTAIIDEETGKLLYVKMSHLKADNKLGFESLNEVICSRLGKQLGFSVAQYEPCLINFMDGTQPTVGCYSESFIPNKAISVSAIDLCSTYFGEYSTSNTALRKVGFSDFVDTIIAWDYLIGNTDRHANNIEFIVFANGDIIPAPIFDNGVSLLSSYGAYPKAWNLDQITNNFLTFGRCSSTFTEIKHTVKAAPLVAVDWTCIKAGIEHLLTEDEWVLIRSFVEHNYNRLVEEGCLA